MGKNIAIIILVGLIAFFGYYAFKTSSKPEEGVGDQASISVVKQKVPVVIYSSDSCPYCVMAKDFFDKKGVVYEERDVRVGKNGQEMMARTNGLRSIPQIFINHKHIGGWGELKMLERQGKLNQLLLGIVSN